MNNLKPYFLMPFSLVWGFSLIFFGLVFILFVIVCISTLTFSNHTTSISSKQLHWTYLWVSWTALTYQSQMLSSVCSQFVLKIKFDSLFLNKLDSSTWNDYYRCTHIDICAVLFCLFLHHFLLFSSLLVLYCIQDGLIISPACILKFAYSMTTILITIIWFKSDISFKIGKC